MSDTFNLVLPSFHVLTPTGLQRKNSKHKNLNFLFWWTVSRVGRLLASSKAEDVITKNVSKWLSWQYETQNATYDKLYIVAAQFDLLSSIFFLTWTFICSHHIALKGPGSHIALCRSFAIFSSNVKSTMTLINFILLKMIATLVVTNSFSCTMLLTGCSSLGQTPEILI